MKFESGWYMASTTNIAPKYDRTIGRIESASIKPFRRKQVAHYDLSRRRLDAGVPWCLDNGVFTNTFDVNYWIEKLDVFLEYKSTCMFIVIPDVVYDCDLSQFCYFRNMVNGFPVALVSQDGILSRVNRIPWNDFDCLFVGGSDNHKLGREGGWIINEAKKHGKWVHIGRVNSASRILKFWRADSWDGTHLGRMPSDVVKFHEAILQVRAMKQAKGLFNEPNQTNCNDWNDSGALHDTYHCA